MCYDRAMRRMLLCFLSIGCGGGGSHHPTGEPAAQAPVVAKGGRVAVAVEETGFVPAEIQVDRGKPVTLVFTRKVEHTCVDRVVFPAEGIDKELPMGKPVEVALAPAADTSFRCPMGHAIGRVTVR